MTYPTHLSSPTPFVIAQISDLHLSPHMPSYREQFLATLALAKSHKPHLLLLTGDLVNDGDKDGYDWLFDVLQKTGVPFLCLAGNHDVTHELGANLPFEQRTFLPTPADPRLIDTHRLILDVQGVRWQLLAVNSAVNGQIYGRLNDDKLTFLTTHLTKSLPTLITLHHHPYPVGSAWIDEHKLINHQAVWDTLAPFDGIHLLCGHVHQAHSLAIGTHHLHTCPATSRQFMPHQDDFGIDATQAGFRLITLTGTHFDSQILRLSTKIVTTP